VARVQTTADNNGLAISPFYGLVFGINNLFSDEMAYICPKPPWLGLSAQLLCNRYFALNTQKVITITKSFPTGLFDATSTKSAIFGQVRPATILQVAKS
jgi:hypothetical protein